ncbi:ABC transporter permease [Thermanaerothrix sp. 4228-RoL]|uniref:ABC transporter permease n=3 Tax=Thermanaerothrix TaxID=1077886 RepID=A0ABU3NL64_9CHLR|nr:ABC transporter permease [Thermanaerothrix sp. 4228-RoL]MDT8897581.1 ABC transporter permease [Thermanaerothrix sp. 4228-RoL]
MRRILLIALKDLLLIFRDRSTVLMILVGPFLLTLGMGLISGQVGGGANSSSGPSDIPVVIVNYDGQTLGNALVNVLFSPELDSLLEPVLVSDLAEAKQQVEKDQAAAAVIIPTGFTQSLIPPAEEWQAWFPSSSPDVTLQIYANPGRPNSVAILESIVRAFLFRVEKGRILGWTAIAPLVANGVIQPAQAEDIGRTWGEALARSGVEQELIQVVVTEEEVTQLRDVNVMASMAPGMALLFLMFTATFGARSLLVERRQQTLQRLMITPILPFQILVGKGIGVYLSGVVQQVLLIGISTWLFALNWGDAFGVLGLILCASLAAVGWGLLIAALARTPAQVASAGSALMLIFGLLGGSFVDLGEMPPAVYVLSRITPNAWGMDGYAILAAGGSLSQIVRPLLALALMGVVLISLAGVILMRSRRFSQA